MKKHQGDDCVAVWTRNFVACKEAQTIVPETIIAADAQPLFKLLIQFILPIRQPHERRLL